MKRKILISFLSLIISASAIACDICGCGVGNSYIGLLPDFYSHIFGLRYRYNYMYTHIGADGQFTYLTTKETYNTVEAWGGWTIRKKIRIMASAPYSYNEKRNQAGSFNKNGIGDISITGYYNLLNKKRAVLKNKLLVQSLWLGGGIKLATGKYNPTDKSPGNNNANLFQLGTGSTDFNISGMYDLRLQDIGMNISSNYRITTVNSDHYQYGNKFSLNTQLYYKFNVKNKLKIAPNIGVQYENAKKDLDNGFNVTASGGDLLLGTIGIESGFRKIAIGANFQTPLSQSLASGIVLAKNRVMAHVAFVF